MTPGTEVVPYFWKASSLPLTRLRFLPSKSVFSLIFLNSFSPTDESERALKHVLCVPLRIFSLHVPLPHKTLVSLIYKPSAGITVSLELKTTDASLCTQIGAQDVEREFLTVCASFTTPTEQPCNKKTTQL